MAENERGLTGERIPPEAYTWRELSELVQQARAASVPTTSNQALEHELSSEPDGPLAPPLLLWMGDNFVMEKGFAEAIDVYSRPIDRFPERTFGEGTWAGLALERIAECQLRLDRPAPRSRPCRR